MSLLLALWLAACASPPSFNDSAQAPALDEEGDASLVGFARVGTELVAQRQGLELHLDVAGARVGRPGRAAVRLRLRGGDASAVVGPVNAKGGRAELDHGGVIEWWEPRVDGFEQGFVLPEGAAPELWVQVQGARVHAGANGGLRLRPPFGPDLLYDGLAAMDADGRPLAATMVPEADGLRIRVEADGARWPITIDPRLHTDWEATTDTVSGGPTSESLGDVNGDGYADVLIGASAANSDDGMLYLFYGGPDGPSTTADWSYTSTSTNAKLGASVSIVGDLDGDGYEDFAAGAPEATTYGSEVYAGEVLVFRGGASGPAASPDKTIQGSSRYYRYGQLILPRGDLNGDGLADLVWASYQGTTSTTSTEQGKVVVYLGSSSSLVTGLTSYAGATAYNHLGAGAAMGDLNGDGYDDLIIGEPDYDDGTKTNAGRVRVFLSSGTGPSSTASWTWTGDTGDRCGAIVSVGDGNGDGKADLALACPAYDTTVTSAGMVAVFYGASSLPTTADWSVTGPSFYSSVGNAMSWAGDLDDDGDDELMVRGVTGAYTASFYYGAPTGLPTSADEEVTSTGNLGSGTRVNGGADVNGDGFDDFVLTALLDGDPADYLVSGSADGMGSPYLSPWGVDFSSGGGEHVAATDVNGDGNLDLIADKAGTSAIGWFGSSAGLPDMTSDISISDTFTAVSTLAGLGDTNGDAHGDLAVGCGTCTNGSTQEGIVYIYNGNSSGRLGTWTQRLEGNQASSSFGRAVAGPGDVNGDGYTDLLVGAYRYDDGETDEGEIFLFLGSSAGLSSTASWTADADQATAYLGSAVGGGDVNGDGYADILASAYSYDYGNLNEGRVSGWFGDPALPPTAADWTWEPDADSVYAGYGVVTADGDLNGDGYDDIVVGSPYDSRVAYYLGSVAVFHGGALGPSLSPDATMDGEGKIRESAFGYRATAGTDFDGDGVDDLVVAAMKESITGTYQGAVFVFGGTAGGVDTDPVLTAYGEIDLNQMGSSLASMGDWNGDGFEDFAVGEGYGDYTQVILGRGTDRDGDGYDSRSDCDDRDVAISPGAAESCDGVDNNCDGAVDEPGTADGVNVYADVDADGFGAGAPVGTACSAGLGQSLLDTDCDDGQVTVYPGAPESCDGLDNDCNGIIDTDATVGLLTFYEDLDGDGYGGGATAQACTAPTGYTSSPGDCDDGLASVSPGAVELCDGVDDDCDGATDEPDAVGAPLWYSDGDGDGYGAGSPTAACSAPAGAVASSDDCDDGDAAVFPGAVESCDGIDDDCDGAVDTDATVGLLTFYEDLDGDGYGGGTTAGACTAPPGYSSSPGDCDDGLASVSPGAAELCDGVDDDCDGTTDEADAVDAPLWYSDGDGDGHGAGTASAACAAPAGWVAPSDDCDDGAAGVFPGAAEHCDSVDEDCDGTADEEAVDAPPWYADADGDSHGDPAVSLAACAAPAGYVEDALDCDDTDDSAALVFTAYRDQDGDGYGDPTERTELCALTDGWTLDSTDCDDLAVDAHPGADEVWYNGHDEACDGGSDYDRDGDGLDSEAWGGRDCDDSDPTVTDCSDEGSDGGADGSGGDGASASAGDGGGAGKGGCNSLGEGSPAVWLSGGLGLLLVSRRRRQVAEGRTPATLRGP